MTDYINNPVYQELIDENDYNGVRSDERVYLDLQASAGYTFEEEKLEINDSKINLSIELKNSTTKKTEVKGMGLFIRRIFICALAARTNFTTQNI